MVNRPNTAAQRKQRHARVRGKISGTPERPRLCVFRSESNIYAQVIVPEIDGIEIEVPDANHIVIKGMDKQKVGQFAADTRMKRPPEPYKGKGIKYTGEVIRRKEGKTGGKKK